MQHVVGQRAVREWLRAAGAAAWQCINSRELGANTCQHVQRCARCAPSPQDFLQLPPIDFNDKLRLASSW